MSRMILVILSLLLFGCGEKDSLATVERNEIDKSRLKECLVSQAISSIVDPKNIMLYAATADLMTRAIVQQKAKVVSECRVIIIGSRNGIGLFDKMASSYCPKKLMELSDDQLRQLDKKAIEIVRVASDLKGTIADKALGSCVEL